MPFSMMLDNVHDSINSNTKLVVKKLNSVLIEVTI